MITTAARIEDMTLNIIEEIHVRASLDATFAALLEQLGPNNETGEGRPMPMKIEPWPGGRWYRDLGENNGHFWGNVQAIKRPTLLEICGPLFMSYPAVSNVQYRLRLGQRSCVTAKGGRRVSRMYRNCNPDRRRRNFRQRNDRVRCQEAAYEDRCEQRFLRRKEN